MAATDSLAYYGSKGIVTRKKGKLVTDRYSLETCTAVFSIPEDDWSSLPTLGAAHPIFTYIAMEHRELEFDGPWAVATCDYAGIPNNSSDFGTPPVYELCVGLGEEPIETHPKFVTDIGGTPSNPINGAQFRNIKTGDIANEDNPAAADSGYVFDSFAVIGSDGKLNDFAKIDHYLDASQLTWRKTWNRRTTVDDVKYAGKIDDPLGPVPKLASPRNWLNMGLSMTQRGSAYQMVQEWRASGPRAWNEIIYGLDTA